MKLLVTGGAGFIGSNFIRYWLKTHPEDQIINFDKLTYAGHLSSTKDYTNNINYRFIKGDICNTSDVWGTESRKNEQRVGNYFLNLEGNN